MKITWSAGARSPLKMGGGRPLAADLTIETADTNDQDLLLVQLHVGTPVRVETRLATGHHGHHGLWAEVTPSRFLIGTAGHEGKGPYIISLPRPDVTAITVSPKR